MKLPNKEISLKVPIFFGTLLLSMDNLKQDTLFMLCYKEKRKRKTIYHCAMYIEQDLLSRSIIGIGAPITKTSSNVDGRLIEGALIRRRGLNRIITVTV